MEFRRILAGSPDIPLMDEVNLEAFPPEELMSTEMQMELAAKGSLEVWAVYDGQSFVGFTTVYPHTRLAYVFFLAVSSKTRSHGYGSRILSMLREQYSGKRIVLDIEPLDPGAPNYDIRVRRKQFYLRNGFLESGYLLEYCGLSFEILYDGPGSFSLADYEELMGGNGIREMIHSCGFDVFKPEISPIG